MEFLDALRGVAALLVAVQHAAELLWPDFLVWSVEVWRPGEFGVVLFFLCSGFIIPASLEKHGSLARFWVGRLFRLYPLYWLALALGLALHAAGGHFPLPAGFAERPGQVLAANLTMVQLFLRRPSVIGASWTLAYEMVFYLLCSLLFLGRTHTRSSRLALGLLAVAAAGGAGLVPDRVLSGAFGWARAAVLVPCAALLLALLCARRAAPDGGTRLLAGGLSLAVVALVLNREHAAFLTFSFFGTMFVGTVLYRAMRGEVGRRHALGVFALALLANALAHGLHVPTQADPDLGGAVHSWRPEVATFLSAYLVFGAGVLLAHRRFPPALTWLGTVSYSVYLVHAVVIHAVPRLESRPATLLLWLACILGLSAVTYRLVERPFQELGARVARGLPPGRPA
jgi:peptidoglycan/LPS O-acetylase OafA/YrhL